MYISIPDEFFIPVVYIEKYILNENEENNIKRCCGKRESVEKKSTETVKEKVIESKNQVGVEPIYVPLKNDVVCKENIKILEEVDEEYLVEINNESCKLDNK